MARAARIAVLCSLLGSGCALKRPPPVGPQGPRSATVPVWRVGEQGTKLYVEATLPDGEARLFLVDTGASISVLSEEVAAALDLDVRTRRGLVVGLGGQARWRNARVAAMELGPFTLHDVDVAVGVPGLPTRAGLVPVAGVLGNNIWQQFTLLLDYPSNSLELWRSAHAPPTPGAGPMYFNGEHIRVEATLEVDVEGGEPVRQPLWLEVDTGAGGLLLAGPIDGPLGGVATEGVEPILGVGAGDDLPMSNFLQQTRRVAVSRVQVGDVVVEEPFTARWINFDADATPIGPAGLPGLLGHTVMDEHRVLIDYERREFALLPSVGPARHRDVHAWALAGLRRARTRDAVLERARLLAWQDEPAAAARDLRRWLSGHPEDAAAQVLLSRLVRASGDADEALELLLPLEVDALLEEHALGEAVNDLCLTGRPEEAATLARAAVTARPEDPQSWVALSDALRARGHFSEARRAIAEANRLGENPEGHLLRRTWLASEEGDLYGAMTHARRLMDLYPSSNLAPWMYAHLPLDPQGADLLTRDIAHARGRLHPTDGPLDFFAGSLRRLGDRGLAERLMREGIARDCQAPAPQESLDNCEAWYRAMAGVDLEHADALIRRAVDGHPGRADFLDTLAMVCEALGRADEAATAATAAARTDPTNLYFLWQAARLDAARATAADPL